MKTLFDPSAQKELQERLEKLSPSSAPSWGKMNAAQMLEHCSRAMRVPTGDLTIKIGFIKHIGKFFRTLAFNDRPFSKNSPTQPEFVVAEPCEFVTSKDRFRKAFSKLAAGPHTVVWFTNGFFGDLSAEEWGKLMYKHTDHHFSQFGV